MRTGFFILFFGLLAGGPAVAQPLLTLEEAVGMVTQRNYTVQTARNTARIAETNHARGNAGFYPTLSFSAGSNGSLANTRQQFIGREAINRTGAQTTRYNAGLQLSWTVFDGLSRLSTYDRLGAEAERAQEQLAATMEEVIAGTMVAYYGLISLEQQRRVQAEAVALSEERLRIAELRRDLGSASELDVRQALVDLNTDRAALLQQEAALQNARAAFNRLLGRPGNPPFTVADTIVVDPSLSLEALLPAALAENPSLKLARTDQAVALYRRREVAADWLPALSLNVGYGYSFLDSESGFLSSSRTYDFTYGLTASYNLFDGFARSRREQTADLALRNAELAVEDTRIAVETTLQTLYTTYRVNLEQIALEQENLAAARLNVEIALERFRLGTISSIELREVQDALVRAESRLIAIQYEAKRAEVELRRQAGLLASGF
ncbi:MAG: TolC family protein [Bacteroidetes bacterium]|nr:hypothetical protein AWN76_004540 [Rhodothermaceae bacterium RA]RMH58564.1 MAG: TolC family protein [Bacteroidota bacterium]